MSVTIHVGDCRDVLREMDAGSVHCVVTSPPYFGLRSYNLPPLVWGGREDCVHSWGDEITSSCYAPQQDDLGRKDYGRGNQPSKKEVSGKRLRGQFCQHCDAWHGCLGLEPTPALYIQHLVSVFREVRRILRDDGQLFLNISDTRTKDRQWHGIPHRLVFALQDDGWRFEDEIIWEKKNCMPGSQTNRFTRSHELVFMLNKSKDAFFDLDAVREAHSRKWWTETVGPEYMTAADGRNDGGKRKGDGNPAGRTKRSVWTVNAPLYRLRQDLTPEQKNYALQRIAEFRQEREQYFT